MSNDQSQHVKGAMAQAVCELAQHTSKETTIEYILPAVNQILKDSVTEVRVSLMNSIDKLAEAIGEENVSTHIIPEIQKLSKDQIWRVRLATIQFVPKLIGFISEAAFKEKIDPMLKEWLEDSVHSVRLEAIHCLIALKNKRFDQGWLEEVFAQKLEEFSSHQKFSLRIHALFCINTIFGEVSDQFLNEKLYKTYMKKLAEDPVPNIRFNFAKTAQLLHKRLSNSSKMDCSSILKKLKESDSDNDVKFYAAQTLTECFQ